MANETDKKMFSETSRVFDNSAKQIQAMAEDLVNLEIKFGSKSSVVKKQREILVSFRQLYDQTLSYINYLRELNHNQYVEFWCSELMRHQRQTGLPVSKIMELAGQDPAEYLKVDELDALINKVLEKIGPINHDVNEFEQFIERLRDGSPTPVK